MLLAARLHAQRLRDETLAHPGRPAQHHRRVLLDEASAGQLPDARLGDLGIVAEVEVAQVAHLIEAGLADAPIEAVGLAPREFVVEQQGQELQRVEAARACLLGARLDGVAHAGEFELPQARLQRVERDHTATSTVTASPEGGGAAQEGPCHPRFRRLLVDGLLQVALQDAPHGPVAPVAGGQGAPAGPLQPLLAVGIAQPQHRLRLAQPRERRWLQQRADEQGRRSADRRGLLQAGLGRPAQEGLARLRVVLQARDPAALLPQMRRHHLRAVVDRDHTRAQAHVEALAHVAVRDGVQRVARAQVAVGLHLGRRPGRRLPGPRRQRLQGRLLALLERHQRLLPRRPMHAHPRRGQAPAPPPPRACPPGR